MLRPTALADRLSHGIENGELRVRYQPKFALSERRPDMAEALVRWRHPELGEVQPNAFVPLAERMGLIRALTAAVLEESLTRCASWRAGGLDVSVAVNLSPLNLLDSTLPGHVEAALARAALDASALQLEVTETVVADAARARDTLERLRALGVSVAIDDFGTGYASLAQLQRLPVDEIKVDRSFVAGMRRGEHGSAAIVRATVGLAHELGLTVTAEGVEDEATTARLARMGCDYLQGFHLAPPLAAAECEELLAERAYAPPAALPAAS